MNTYQILIEYVGTNFSGWQIQKNGLTVQAVIQKCLNKILKEKILVFGSGRTDSGVHATGQSAHFKTKILIQKKENFLKSLNYFLSKYEVSIKGIKKRESLFHARHSARKREYRYIIINRPASLSLEKNRAWHVRKKLNIKSMKKGANILKGRHDFSSYRASSCTAKSPIKNLEKVKITKNADRIMIVFTSRSFLQQQVRSMVGCLKYLGEEKWNLKKFNEVLVLKKRVNCAPPAPPMGLYLTKVEY